MHAEKLLTPDFAPTREHQGIILLGEPKEASEAEIDDFIRLLTTIVRRQLQEPGANA